MPKNSLSSLLGRIGNKRTRSDVLQVMSFPGLSVDNVPSIPSVLTDASSTSTGSSVDQQVAGLSQQLGDLKTAQQNEMDRLTENTQALAQNTGSRSGTSSTSATSGMNIASSILSATGISPIITGLLDLFGGSSSEQTVPALTPFSVPPSIQYAGALQSNGSVAPVDYGQNGQLRSLGASPQQSAQTTVQVQVNAIDSQSFLDHSEDIAQAVRYALLNSSTLNDVIAGI